MSSARVERFAFDAHARTIALVTLPASAPGTPRAALAFVLEPSGGVTVAEGLARPTRHVLSALPTRLRGARAALESLRSEAARLYWAAAADAGGVRGNWAAALADALLAPRGAAARLDWSASAAVVAADWARRWVAGADPVVAGARGSADVRSSASVDVLLWAHAAHGGSRAAADGATHAPAVSPAEEPARIAFYWSPRFLALNVHAEGTEVVGFAWTAGPGAATAVWPFVCDVDGIVSWTRVYDGHHAVAPVGTRAGAEEDAAPGRVETELTRALSRAGANSDDATSIARLLTPAGVSALRSTAGASLMPSAPTDPRSVRVRALLSAGGWLRGAEGAPAADEAEAGLGVEWSVWGDASNSPPDYSHRVLPLSAVPHTHAQGSLALGARAASALIDLGPGVVRTVEEAAAAAAADERARARAEASVSRSDGRVLPGISAADVSSDSLLGRSSFSSAAQSAAPAVSVRSAPSGAPAWDAWSVPVESREIPANHAMRRDDEDFNFRAVQLAAARSIAASDSITRRLREMGI
jgi:hypothetical protein